MRIAPPRLIVWACLAALTALALIVWSLFDPRPIPVIAAMSIGQVIGTASFVSFLLAIVSDLRNRYVRRAPTGAKTSDLT